MEMRFPETCNKKEMYITVFRKRMRKQKHLYGGKKGICINFHLSIDKQRILVYNINIPRNQEVRRNRSMTAEFCFTARYYYDYFFYFSNRVLCCRKTEERA